MSVGFSRVLFLPHDDTPLPPELPQTIATALLDAGLVRGEADEPWDLRPAGALSQWCKKLRVRGVEVVVELKDEPVELGDLDAPPFGPYSSCPRCGRVVPTNGLSARNPMTGAEMRIPIRGCDACGETFDASTWPAAEAPRRFEARLLVSVEATRYERARPGLSDGCPAFVECVNEAVGRPLTEVYQPF